VTVSAEAARRRAAGKPEAPDASLVPQTDAEIDAAIADDPDWIEFAEVPDDAWTTAPGPICLAAEHRPSLVERMWRKLGFRRAFVPAPDTDDYQGRMVITTVTSWSLADRVRILISGRTYIFSSSITEPNVDRAVTTVAVSVLPPTLKRMQQ
jgi:hypothetical protein